MLCHCSQRTSKGRAHVLKTEQVLNKLLDQVISHLRGRGHWIYLAIINHFATFAQAFATANKSGKTAAAELCGDFALRRKLSEKTSRELGWGNSRLGSCSPRCWTGGGQGSLSRNAEVDGGAGGDRSRAQHRAACSMGSSVWTLPIASQWLKHPHMAGEIVSPVLSRLPWLVKLGSSTKRGSEMFGDTMSKGRWQEPGHRSSVWLHGLLLNSPLI